MMTMNNNLAQFLSECCKSNEQLTDLICTNYVERLNDKEQNDLTTVLYTNYNHFKETI